MRAEEVETAPWPRIERFRWPAAEGCRRPIDEVIAHLTLHGTKPHQNVVVGNWLLYHPDFLIIEQGSEIEVQRGFGEPAVIWAEKSWGSMSPDVRRALATIAEDELRRLA